jgi:hypothetical protein
MESDSLAPADLVYLTCMIENKGKTVDYDAYAVRVDTVARIYRMEYHPPIKNSAGDLLKMYVWNPSRRNLKLVSGKGTLFIGK